ncbi:uncharacterized protein LOC126482089 [Schistocerca serialis cubense]|uniref:uncharacterized protein LOC126482089 n=1 Tax=Schistocerca serialis cubense TaxID=2023355 RepID=UPI00214E7267|nr:uncharacterized protein LOC126482089 [Schistocerca serialis cubense]
MLILSSHQTAVREDREIRRGRLENRALQIAIQESVDTLAKMVDAISFDSLEQLKTKLSECKKHSDWVVMNKSDSVSLVLLKHNPYPKIFCQVVISSGLLLSVFSNDIEMKCIGNMKFPMKVNNIQVVSDVLKNIYLLYSSSEAPVDNILSLIDQLLQNLLEKLPGNETKITFLKEQISFLKCRSSTQFRYDTNSMIMWSLLHSISQHADKFLRNSDSFCMPSPNTLSRLCSTLSTNPVIEQQGDQFMSYITNKVSTLSSDDKTVLLLMDEIHLKSQLDYNAGNVVGCAFNTDRFLCATSAYVFMVQSMESPYKDVVSILPVHTIQGDVLFSYIKTVILKLQAVEIEVVGIVADNNAINKKVVSKFSTPPDVKIKYDHPVQSSPNRPLYYFLDTVHILKCICNNWFKQKEQILCFLDFSDSLKGGLSSVGALKELHLIEKDELLQYGSSLTLKSLFPNSIERQNVKLVLRIFNDTTVVALDTFGSKKAISNWESEMGKQHIDSDKDGTPNWVSEMALAEEILRQHYVALFEECDFPEGLVETLDNIDELLTLWTLSRKEVEKLLREALVTVDAASWRKKVEHVEKLIRAAQTIEGIISAHEQLMICLADDDDEDGFGDESDNSDDGELDGIAPLSL